MLGNNAMIMMKESNFLIRLEVSTPFHKGIKHLLGFQLPSRI